MVPPTSVRVIVVSTVGTGHGGGNGNSFRRTFRDRVSDGNRTGPTTRTHVISLYYFDIPSTFYFNDKILPWFNPTISVFE